MLQNIDIGGITTSVVNAWQNVKLAKVTSSVEIARIQVGVSMATISAQWQVSAMQTTIMVCIAGSIISFFVWAVVHDSRK